jgi:hypothetical protein
MAAVGTRTEIGGDNTLVGTPGVAAGNDTIVRVSTAGDNDPELEIVPSGQVNLAASNFVL